MILSELYNGQLRQTEVGDVTFQKTYDVVVCGLGTAGGMAAIFAAENGLTVLGIESFNCVGGTTTIGGVDGHYFSIPGGRYMAVDEVVFEFEKNCTHSVMDARKLAEEEMIVNSGAEVLYESSVVGVYLKGRTVSGVKVITPDGMLNVSAGVVFDCTGDIFVATMAGCETVYGRETDGLAQPYTMVSMVNNGERYHCTNCDFGRVDANDDKALSEALIFSRGYEMAEEKRGLSRRLHMPLIGIREGRQLVAEEIATLDDFLSGKKTEEPVLYAYADLDKHGWDIAFDGEVLGDWFIGANLGAYNVRIPISFRSVIPKEIDGLLVPCRGLGVDRDVASCARMVVNMQKLAEVSADMVLLAKKHGCSLREIPYEELRERLLKSGCLNTAYTSDYRIDAVKEPEDVFFTKEPEDLEKRLATDTPGQAIWSAKLMGDRAKETLKELLTSTDENTRKHASFALALLGDDAGQAQLHGMVRERDAFTLKDCRKHNQQRGVMAIYLLGKLRDASCAELLIDLITNPDEHKHPSYQNGGVGTRYAVSDFNNVYFQFVSNAVMALIRIGEAHSELRGKIKAAFGKAFADGTYYSRFTQRPQKSSEGGMVLNLKNVAEQSTKNW